ncbi:MAG: sugar phosphate isomerase/epimerase [Clostridia bacterium]|nr:sugar phosphate isomerase/epimerase [Clostridia bacterium]
MYLSINPKHFQKAAVWEADRDILEAIGLVTDAGFTRLDFGTEDAAEANRVAEYLSDAGIKVNQSHLPYNRYKGEDYEPFARRLMAAAKCAKIMGSPILVVHGDEFPFGERAYSREAAREFNYRLFAPVVEFAGQNGMQVAFETVFQDMDPLEKPRHCSLVEELCALVDLYASPTVGICWDSGHAKVQYGVSQPNLLKIAGKRVISTHIHDNYYGKDLHTFPFMGDTDWKKLMETFAAIGYTGDLTFELVYDRLPRALAPDYLKLLHTSGEMLMGMMKGEA